MLIVAGDWNARPGPMDMATRHTLGKFSLGTSCAYGERFLNCASANRIVVFSTHFQLPQGHLLTGFLMMDAQVTKSTTCRAYNGAQAGSEYGSDHAMVRAFFWRGL